jgi:VIT1/CCC1 family predicted Fe2+/Mn2+ transporter
MTTSTNSVRYRTNYQEESESAQLYAALAAQESDAAMAGVLARMGEMEQRHADIWAQHLRAVGESVPEVRPGWRTRLLIWLGKHFGAGVVLPMVAAQEQRAVQAYATQPEAVAAAMPQDERMHARLFRALQGSEGRIGGSALAQLEGRHRATGGNALRAAVLGASDGLTSNLSLVMGVAGASPSERIVLLTGLAGMLAGACSMTIGEWLSVQSARELYARQIAIEREELEQSPADEQEELALIYQAKGLDATSAEHLAAQIISQPDNALDTLAREELGLDPQELGGSAWVAAATSFLLFSLGALIPVLPFLFGAGLFTIVISLLLSVLGLLIIGTGISLTTGTSLWRTCSRQVGLGLAAAAVTFSLGKLIGARLA